MKIPGRLEARTVVERSRFFAVALPCDAEEEFLAAVAAQRKAHHKAVHHCWALRLRTADGRLLEKSKDDGEVGHPGRVLLELLRRRELEGGVVVSRVYGGVKLGVGGVSRAFREAGEAALDSA